MQNKKLLAYSFIGIALFATSFFVQQKNFSEQEAADAAEQTYSDEITDVTERVENNLRIVTEHHDNARIPFITVYKYPVTDGVSGAAVPPPQNVGGTNYYRVTSTDTAEDSGDEVCALATGSACSGYVDESVTGFNVCTAYNPTAATVTDVNGDLSVAYCDGAPQAEPCNSLPNTCLACPTCTNGVACHESIGGLYREMYVTCAAASSDVGLNGGTTTLSTSSDLVSQVSVLGSGQGAYTWDADGTFFTSLNIPFNSGATQNDYSGNGYNGTILNTPDYTTPAGCQVGGCMEFNGTNEQVDINQTLTNFMTSVEGSISVWAKPTAAAPIEGQSYTGDAIISATYFAGLAQANVGGEDRIWAFNFDGGEDRIGATYNIGEWVHLVWVHGGGKLRLYKNGSQVGEIESGNTQSMGSELRIGNAQSFGKHFQGYVDETQIWSIALSDEEIAQLYADGNANNPGPTQLDSLETIATDEWNLTVNPLDMDGYVLTPTISANTVTIDAPTITGTLNLSGTTLSTFSSLSSVLTGLNDPKAAYTWTENGSSYMTASYPFNSGNNQLDYSGNNRTAVRSSAAFSSPKQGHCKIGSCYFFDGINDHIDTNLALSNFITSTEGSFSVWAKPSVAGTNEGQSYTGDMIVSGTYFAGISQASIGGEDRLWAFNWDGGEDRVGATYNVGEWVHLTWVHGGGQLSLYKNGALVGSVPSGNTQNLGVEVRIGNAQSFGKHFNGYIDDLQFYNFALSANQVAQLYTDGDAGNAGPTVIAPQETVAGDTWQLTATPFEEDGTPLAVVDTSTTVTITIPSTSANINGGTTTLSTTQDLTSSVSGVGDPQLAYTWSENGSPFLSSNYPFNVGASQLDYSGNSYTATVFQAAFSPQGQGLCQVGGCYFFDGVDDHIDTNQPLSSFMTDTSGTMSVWVNPSVAGTNEGQSYTGDMIVSATYFAGISQANIGGEDRLWAFGWDGDEDRVGTTYNVGEWVHLTWVHGGGQLSLYKNGVLVGSVPSGNTENLGTEFRIGNAASFGKPFNGYIDEVQTWDFALSANQIAQLYTDGNANLASPSQIESSETISADVWTMSVTPFKGDGSPLSTTNATNTVTIVAPMVTVELNGGSGIIDPSQDLLTNVTGLGVSAAAYEWELNSSPYMTLNYPFNAGNTQTDYSGNGFDGTRNGASFSVQGQGLCQVGACHFYDGVNDHIDTNQPLSSLMTATDGTISVWARPTSAATAEGQAYTGDMIVSATYFAGISQANIGGEDRLWAFGWDGDEDRIGTTYTVDEWTHLVWMHTGGQIRLYKDSVLVGSIPSGNTENMGTEFRVGNAQSFGKHFQGYIDEVQVWNKALPQDQIDILYADGLANVAGPRTIADEEVTLGDDWGLSVTPFESDGTPFAPNSGNVVSGFINTPPNTPSRVSPADGLTTVELSPELSVNYTDIDAGHLGTTDYRVSTGSAADCINNINVVDFGTSAATATINESTVYTVSIILADMTTYNWCARNYDTFDYSDAGAYVSMGEFTVDTTYSEGGSSPQKQQAVNPTNPDSNSGDSDSGDSTEGDDSSSDSTEDTDSTEDDAPEDDGDDESSLPPVDPNAPDDSGDSEGDGSNEGDSEEGDSNEGSEETETPSQEEQEAPGDGQAPPPPPPPTQEESSTINRIFNELIDTEAEDAEPEGGRVDDPSSSETGVNTNSSSDGRSFTIEVEDEVTEDELIITGLAQTEEDRIEFTGTTSQPGSTVTLIFDNNVTVVVTSDDNGNWQTFVSAGQLGISRGQQANVQIDAIAAKGNLTSEKVSVGRVALNLGSDNEIVAEFESVAAESEITTNIQSLVKKLDEVIEEQELVVQQTLSVAAPVVIVASAPLWGYLPYIPTLVYHFISYLLGLVGRRKQKGEQLFGEVYDSITKQPLGLAVLRIYNKATNKLVATKVSDKFGRYDLLLEPGEYRIEVKKPNFTFPSKIVTSGPDGAHVTIYNHEQGLVSTEGSFSVPDIPVDPVNAKRQFGLANILKKFWMMLQKIGHYLALPVLLVGSIASVMTLVAIPESLVNWLLAGMYIFLLILQLNLRPKVEKAWGVVYDLTTSAVLPLTTIQLIDPEYGKVVNSRLTDYEGRFAFLPQPGKYLVKASKPGYQQPGTNEAIIQKEGQRIDGDIAMKQE